MKKPLLILAIDLEEFYGPGGAPAASATPLPELVEPLLRVMAEADVRATFFAVGEVARRHPDVVRRIAGEGHEIACHGDKHLPLTELSREGFGRDLRANIDAVCALGVDAPIGFRAPLLSLGPEQAWAYAEMRAAGITYSSSVLPARTPLHGWPEFGASPRECEGVLEIPVTVTTWGRWRVPCFCGTYFRVLPDFLTRRMMRRAASESGVGGYLHPYDFDVRQAWTWHAQLQGRLLLNHLLFVRRGSMMRRFRALLDSGWTAQTYREHAAALRQRLARTAPRAD